MGPKMGQMGGGGGFGRGMGPSVAGVPPATPGMSSPMGAPAPPPTDGGVGSPDFRPPDMNPPPAPMPPAPAPASVPGAVATPPVPASMPAGMPPPMPPAPAGDPSAKGASQTGTGLQQGPAKVGASPAASAQAQMMKRAGVKPMPVPSVPAKPYGG